MYFNATNTKFDQFDTVDRASYLDVIMCLESATLISGEMQANIETISVNQFFDQPNASANNNNNNASNAAPSNNNSNQNNTANPGDNTADFWDKARVMSNKFFAILAKLKDTIVSFIKNIGANIGTVIQKLQAKIKSIGVERSLIELKNNGKNYGYDQNYFDNKVSNAKFANPLSADIIKFYEDFINKCTDNLNRVKNNQGDNITIEMSNEDKDKLKEIENREITGQTLATDSKMMYFSNNLNTCLPNVQGLFDSLNPKRSEVVVKPVTQAVNKFLSIADPLLKNTKTSIDRAAAVKNADEYKHHKATYDALKKAMSLVAKVANDCQRSIVKMNISRLKIINTFIKLWRFQGANNNNNNQNNQNNNQNNQNNNANNNNNQGNGNNGNANAVGNNTEAP